MSDGPRLVAACHGTDPALDGWPTVSVVVPVRNEAPDLRHAVESILDQGYPGHLDVCLAVAPSDDDTASIADELAAGSNGRVHVVDNPAGVTPAGLNRAIGATRGSIVVRVDGHAALSEGYVRRAVETMCRTGAVNVGGRQVPAPQTRFEESVAAATTSWMGTGGATYRVGGEPGPVDTVYLGVFDRAAGDAVGWFDESLIRNQDYELNIRLRQAGGVVWFDPELAVSYRPRSSWKALAKQYYEYGWWKAEVLHRSPGSVRLRQVIPAAAVMTAVGGALWSSRRPAAAALPLGYALVLLAGSSERRWQRGAVVATIHVAWSIGLMVGALSSGSLRRRPSHGAEYHSRCGSQHARVPEVRRRVPS